MSNLYNRIENLCFEKSISITTMCKKSGASRASLSDLKCGRNHTLSAETLSKIATYFGVSVDYLLGKEEKEKTPDQLELTEGEVAFIKLLRRVPAEDRPIVIEKILSALDAQV
jgi:transcriptional regulator with XRE-family HTH domain